MEDEEDELDEEDKDETFTRRPGSCRRALPIWHVAPTAYTPHLSALHLSRRVVLASFPHKQCSIAWAFLVSILDNPEDYHRLPTSYFAVE